MKTRLVVSFIVVAFILGAWYFTRPASYLPGKVESQIHAFGMQLAPALAPNSTFHAVANGCQPQPEPPQAPAGLKPVEAQARTAMAQHHAGEAALVPTFPERYSAGTEVRGEGMVVKLMPLASNAAQAQIENGKLVYHNAYPSTDSLNVVTDGRSEEFLLLHDTAAPQRFEYDVSAISGVKSITLQDNSVHFTSADGKQMQIEAPWLIESGQPVAGAGPCASAFLPQVAVDRRATVQASPPKVHWELSFPNGPTQPRLALVVTNTSKLHYPVVIDPTWVVTNGSLNTARGYQTATLLNNGQVLVAGGYGEYNNALANAELYNPITGTWTATGSLKTARYIHTATLLANGQVLVMGGYGSLGASYGALASAELYNPGTGTWTATGSLVTARYSHTTTLLANGQALVAGGYCSSGLLGSAELYNPVTGTWTNTGSLITARDGHTATLLSNGQVLVNGGGGS